MLCVQVKEVGLPGPMDLALIPVGMGPEQAPETAPLSTILTDALVTTTCGPDYCLGEDC